MTGPDLDRRAFLRAAAAAGMTGALAPAAFGREDTAPEPRPIPRRELGRTGLRVSLFGLGTYYLGRMARDEEADRLLRRALEHGVNYVDTAPSYKNGRAERRVGAAIAGRRDRVVIATKSFQKDADRVLEELEASLGRLGTDHVDVFQMHSVQTAEDLEHRFGPGGAIEGFLKAKKQGKARFLGVTGHKDPTVLNDALGRFAFDTVLMPLNCVDRHFVSFIETTLPVAVRKNMGVIGMKVFAGGRLLKATDGPVSAEDCIRYAASLTAATTVLGCDSVAQVDANAAVLRGFERLDAASAKAILARSAPLEGTATEWYKK